MSFKDLKAKRSAETARKAAIFADSAKISTKDDGPEHHDLYEPLVGSNLEVRMDPVTGRGLYTGSEFKPGSRLLSLTPHICAISTRFLQQFCSLCASEKQVRRCTKCLKVAYCSQSCQKEDWAIHKEECVALQRWAAAAPNSDTPADSIRAIARLLWSRKIMKPNSWHEVVAMQSNREKLSLELQESYAHLVQSLVLYMDLRSPEALHSLGIDSAKDMVNLVSQFTINTFTLTSPLLDAIGITICPLAALINHSCDPNAVIVFPNSFKGIYPTLEILSVQPIKVGEEIVAAYVDITLPKALRQKSLNGTYAFDCKCSECTREVPLDLRECMFCPQCQNGSISIRKDSTRNCSKCGRSSVPPDDFVDKLKLANDGLEKVEKLQFQDPDYALSLATNVLGLISPFTPPSSHPRLALMRVLQTLSIEAMNTKNSAASTSVDSVIRLSAQIVAALVDLLPHGHPIRGVAIATLGRLLCVDEPEVPANVSPEQQQQAFPPRGYQRLALAKSTLLRALDELNVGFGSGGGILGTEMRHTLEGVDREMSVFERGVRNARESLKQTS